MHSLGKHKSTKHTHTQHTIGRFAHHRSFVFSLIARVHVHQSTLNIRSVVDGEGYPLEEPRVKRTVEEYIEFALSDPSTLVKEEEPEPEQNEELAASEIE